MGRTDATTLLLLAHVAVLIGLALAVVGAGTAMCERGSCPGGEAVGLVGSLVGAVVAIDLIWAVLAWSEVRKVREAVPKRALSVAMVLVPMLAWYVAVVRWNRHLR